VAEAYFKTVSQVFERDRELKVTISHSNWSQGADLIPGPPEYKAGIIVTMLHVQSQETRSSGRQFGLVK
jgi:hypothetical protein